MWPADFSSTLVIVTARDVWQQQQQLEAEHRLPVKHAEVACQESFLLVLPNLTSTTRREWAQWKRADLEQLEIEQSRSDYYEPELQPPLWWLSHPLAELRQHAVGLQLIRSFSIPRFYTTRSSEEWNVPALREAKVKNAVVWQLRIDECGSIKLLHLTSNTNASITLNLTTTARPSSPLNYTLPLAALEWTDLNRIVYSPHSYTFMLPAAYFNASASFRRFH